MKVLLCAKNNSLVLNNNEKPHSMVVLFNKQLRERKFSLKIIYRSVEQKIYNYCCEFLFLK